MKKTLTSLLASLAFAFVAFADTPDYLSFTARNGDAELGILEVSGTRLTYGKVIGDIAQAKVFKRQGAHRVFQYSFNRENWHDFNSGFWCELNEVPGFDMGPCPTPDWNSFDKLQESPNYGEIVKIPEGTTIYIRRHEGSNGVHERFSVNSLASIDGDGSCTILLRPTTDVGMGDDLRVEADGNVLSLLDRYVLPRPLGMGAFRNLFFGCKYLASAPKLPDVPLAEGCYEGMFMGCFNLTNAPVLSATTLAKDCYKGMFVGCTNLTDAPVLSAMTLAVGCYEKMFADCPNLGEAPALPATNLADRCYQEMFIRCHALTNAPALPAETFWTSLGSGYAYDCYKAMFMDCTNLSEVTVGFTEWDTDRGTPSWLANVAETGTFVCPYQLWAPDDRGEDTIPEGWEIVRAPCVELTFTGGVEGIRGVDVDNRTQGWGEWLDLTDPTADLRVYADFGDKIVLTYDAEFGYEFTSEPEINLGKVLADRTFTAADYPARTSYGTPDYLSFTARDGEVDICIDAPSVGLYQYSFDKTSEVWTAFSEGASVRVSTNETLYVRYMQSMTPFGSPHFSMEAADDGATVEAGGNVMSLVDPSCRSTYAPARAFAGLFQGCEILTKPPRLPATELETGCYAMMFQECSRLGEAPELPATALATQCYMMMFCGCTNLTEAPVLPAMELETACYMAMFADCRSMTDAPALPAMYLAQSCYANMFMHCLSLTNAPALMAPTLVEGCYMNMFDGCTSLSEVTVGFTDWGNEDSDSATSHWLNDVAEDGVLHCSSALAETIPFRDYNYLPLSWTFGCEVSDWALLRMAVINAEHEFSLSCEAFDHTNYLSEAAQSQWPYKKNVNIIRLKKDITATELSTAISATDFPEVIIDLAGHVLDRGLADQEPRADGRIFDIGVYGYLTVMNGTLTGGNVKGDGGVILLEPNDSPFVVSNCVITGNRATGSCGAVSAAKDGRFPSPVLAGDTVVSGNFAAVANDLLLGGGRLAEIPAVGEKMAISIAPPPLAFGESVRVATNCPPAVVDHLLLDADDPDLAVVYSNDTKEVYVSLVPYAKTVKLFVPTNVANAIVTVIDAASGKRIAFFADDGEGRQICRVLPGTTVEVHVDPVSGYAGESKTITKVVDGETAIDPKDYPTYDTTCCTVRFVTDAEQVRAAMPEELATCLLGEILPEGATVKGDGDYPAGKKVTLAAKAPKGYKFAGWWNLRPMLDGKALAPQPLIGAAVATDYRAAKVTLTAEDGVGYELVPLFVRPEQDFLNVACFNSLPAPISLLAGTADEAAVALVENGEYKAIRPDGVKAAPLPVKGLKSHVGALEFTAGVPVESGLFVFSGSQPTVGVKGLPKGVKFNKKTGRLSGTPTTPGVTYATIEVKNASGYVTAKVVACYVRNFDKGVKADKEIFGRLDFLENRYVEDEIKLAADNKTVRLLAGDSLGFKPEFIPVSNEVTVAKVAKKSLPSGLKYDAKTGFITGTIKKPGSYAAIFNITLSTGETVPASIIFFVDEQGFAYPGRQVDLKTGTIRGYGKELIPQGEGMSTIAYLCGRCKFLNGVNGLGHLETTRNVKFAMENSFGNAEKSFSDKQCFLEFDRYIPVGTSLSGAFAYGYEGRTDYTLPIASLPTDKDNYIKVTNLPKGLKLVAKKLKAGEEFCMNDLQMNQAAIDPSNYSSFYVRSLGGWTVYSIVGTATKPGVYLTKWELCCDGAKSVFNRRYVVTAGPSGFFRVKPYCFGYDTILSEEVMSVGLGVNFDLFEDVGGLDMTPGKVFTPTSKLKFKATAKPGYAFCGYAMSQAYDYLTPPRGSGKARTEPYEMGTTSPELALSPQMAKSYTLGYIDKKGNPNAKYGFAANPTNLAVRAAYVKTADDFCAFWPGVLGSMDDAVTSIEWPVGAYANKFFKLNSLVGTAVGISDVTIAPVGKLPAGFMLNVGAFMSGAQKAGKKGYPNGRDFTVVCDPSEAVPGVYEFDLRAETRSGQSAVLHVKATVPENYLNTIPLEQNGPFACFIPEYAVFGRYESMASSNVFYRPVANFLVERGRTYKATKDNLLHVCTLSIVDAITTEPALPNGLKFEPVVEYGMDVPMQELNPIQNFATSLSPRHIKWYLVGKTTEDFDADRIKVIAHIGAFSQERDEAAYVRCIEDDRLEASYPEWVNHPYTEFHVVDPVEPIVAADPLRPTVLSGVGRQLSPGRLPYLARYVTDEAGVITGTAPCEGERMLPVNGEISADNRDLYCALGVPLVIDLGTDEPVTVAGLPKGLKLDGRTIVGKPTKVGTSVIALSAGAGTDPVVFNLTVLPTPEWAVGNFEGVLNLGVLDVVSTFFDLSDIDFDALKKFDGDWQQLITDFASQYWRNVGFGPLGAVMTAAKGLLGTTTGKLTLKVGKDGKITGSAKILGKSASVAVTGFESARIATAKIDPSARTSENYDPEGFVQLAHPWTLSTNPLLKDATKASDNTRWAFLDTASGKILYRSLVDAAFGDAKSFREWTPIAADGEPTLADRYNILLREKEEALAEYADASLDILNRPLAERYAYWNTDDDRKMAAIFKSYVDNVANSSFPETADFNSTKSLPDFTLQEGEDFWVVPSAAGTHGLYFKIVRTPIDGKCYLGWSWDGQNTYRYIPYEKNALTVGEYCYLVELAWQDFFDYWAEIGDDGHTARWNTMGKESIDRIENVLEPYQNNLSGAIGMLTEWIKELPRVTYDRYVETAPYVDAYTAKATVKWNGKVFTTSVTLTDLNRKTRELFLAADTSLTEELPAAPIEVGTLVMGPLSLLNGIGYDAADDEEWSTLIALTGVDSAFTENVGLVIDDYALRYRGGDGRDNGAYRDFVLKELKWLRTKAFGAATQKIVGTKVKIPADALKADQEEFKKDFELSNSYVKLALGALKLPDVFAGEVKFGNFTKNGELSFTFDLVENGVKSSFKFSGTALPVVMLTERTLLGRKGTLYIANCAAQVPRDIEVNGVVLLKKGATVFVPVPFLLDEQGLVDPDLGEDVLKMVMERINEWMHRPIP